MSDPCSFADPLLRWWRSEDRIAKYPWRMEKDPYRIAVSEILLQRTRRDAVARVYSKFFEKFPTADSLSRASEMEVSETIKSLGLAKRARYLIEVARALRKGGISSGSRSELPRVLGLGRYSRSMILSAVSGERTVAVDKNVARVICRTFGIAPKNPGRPQDDSLVNEIALRCAPRENVREYNLALLDLGWEVCLPRKPRCGECPISGLCSFAMKVRGSAKTGAPPHP